MTIYLCVVCDQTFTQEPHTYHEEGCPVRDTPPCEAPICQQYRLCGGDCHPECCPTCTGQAL